MPTKLVWSYATQAVNYIDKVLAKVSGLKALLIDEEVKQILSVVYSQHQLLRHEVVFVDMISKIGRRPMRHLKCVAILRPTPQNIGDLSSELASCNYQEYHVVFTNMVDVDQLQSLVNAEPTTVNLVRSVEEIYLDGVPAMQYVSVVNAEKGGAGHVSPVTLQQCDNSYFLRVALGICSAMLAMKRRPLIRYRGNNKATERIATEVNSRMRTINSLFSELKAKDCVLLVLDRMDDPVTPLLTQWTYEAMLHELIGFTAGNEIEIEGATVEERTQVLSSLQDSFYAKHQYANWGDLCLAVRELVETYKSLNNIDKSTASLDDIKSFVARFPEAKQQSTQMTKHTTLVGALADEVTARNLTDLSLLEQEIIANNAISDHSKAVLDAVSSPSFEVSDALRLAILYSLKYEGRSSCVTGDLKKELAARGCPPEKVALIDTVLQIGGARHREGELELFASGGFLKSFVHAISAFSGGDVKNVFTQHRPLLHKQLLAAYNGTLSETDFPFVGTNSNADGEGARDILVFMFGGITCEEVKVVHEFNVGTVVNPQEESSSARSEGREGGDGGNLFPDFLRPKSSLDEHHRQQQQRPVAGEAGSPKGAILDARVAVVSTGVINSRQFLSSVAAL